MQQWVYLFVAATLTISLSACGGESGSTFRNGDPTNGQQVFSTNCASCHSTGQDILVGPGLAGLFQPGGPTLPPGVDYGGKLPNGQAITEVNVTAWIKGGGAGQIGYMTPQNLTDEQLADVIAYLKTLNKE